MLTSNSDAGPKSLNQHSCMILMEPLCIVTPPNKKSLNQQPGMILMETCIVAPPNKKRMNPAPVMMMVYPH